MPPMSQSQGPQGSAQGSVAVGVDPTVKEAQERNRASHQS